MRPITALFVMLLLASCTTHPERPFLVGLSESAAKSQSVTIWTDNQDLSYMLIQKIDGEKTQSFWTTNSAPVYSVTTTPGSRTISVLVSDLSDFNPFLHGGKYADVDVTADLEPGHDYVLKHRVAYGRVSVYIEDLGTDKSCRYKVTGKMRQGYTPVALICE